MDVVDAIRVAVRLGHALAAALWVGGGLFYLVALNPAIADMQTFRERPVLLSRVSRHFRDTVRLAVASFIFTGAVLTFDRLAQAVLSTGYVVVLGIKIALSLAMFWMAGRLSSEASVGWRLGRLAVDGPTLVLTLGITVYLLAIVLKVMFERELITR